MQRFLEFKQMVNKNREEKNEDDEKDLKKIDEN